MSNAIIPTHEDLMWPTLRAIRELGGSARNLEIEVKVIEIGSYSEDVIAFMHNERQSKIQYRLAWSRTWLKNIGALESREATVWILTDLGQNISEAEMQEAVRVWRSRYVDRKKKEKIDLDGGDEEGSLGMTIAGAEGVAEAWIDEMLDAIKKLSPQGFERLCQRILRESGFENVELSPGSNDKGIDGTGTLRMGILSWDVIFQCKRYAEKVGSPDMQRFKGTMAGRSEKGLFMTTGTFTFEAIAESKRDGAPPVDLYDGTALCRLMKELNLGVKVVAKEEIQVQGDFFGQYN